MERERDSGHSQASNDGSVTSLSKRESPPCQQDDNDDSQGRKRFRCSWLDLPEVRWYWDGRLLVKYEISRTGFVDFSFRQDNLIDGVLVHISSFLLSSVTAISLMIQLLLTIIPEEYYFLCPSCLCDSSAELFHLCVQEIWHHIHSLVPMREAAQAACVSHAFLHSWRCHTNLKFSMGTICSKESLRQDQFDVNQFNNNIEHILVNHSTFGVKTLVLKLHGPYGAEYYNRLNSWLKIAVTPMTEELTLVLEPWDWPEKITYNFPCSLLSDISGNTLRYLHLDTCVLRPTSELGMKGLTTLHLRKVRITGDELGCLLSNCLALEQLKLRYCDDIICLVIPCLLQRLSYLHVFECESLQVIENKAPNLSSFSLTKNQIQLPVGESLKLKKLKLYHESAIGDAIGKLPSRVPNLETLRVHSFSEVSAPIACSKFLHLKFLTVHTSGWDFNHEDDYLSLVSFFDASPSLVTFVLHVSKKYNKYDWLQGYPSSLRQMTERQHNNLKNVKITGFCPQKSIIELTLHILNNTTSLECLTLETFPVYYRRCGNISDKKCPPLDSSFIMQARDTILAIKTYIEGKVRSTAKLNVPEPCNKCHAL